MEPLTSALPLEGIRVLDAGTLFAGPLVGTLLGDYGADVIKIEHPKGDSLRTLGWAKDGQPLWWALTSRNKRCVTLKLSSPDGQEVMRELVATADVLVESFRPGTMERWGLGWDVLREINPRLVMVRTTGFGQTGPYSSRPGYGTLAEAMSGFAHMNGSPDGPPTLPPFALGDGVAGIIGALATMIALYERDQRGSGKGQVVDLSIFEPLFWLLGPQATLYDQLGIAQGRSGNRAPFTAPRNAYCARDGVWLALSASSQSIADRVMQVIGREDLAEQPWYASHAGRLAHQDEVDDLIAAWIGERDAADVVAAFETAEAAIAPVMSIVEIMEDPQYLARGTIIEVEHPVLGSVKMQGVVPKLERTPGRVRSVGASLGEHNEEVYCDDLHINAERLKELKANGSI